MNELDRSDRVRSIFAKCGALGRGHIQFKDGRHSDQYIEKFTVLSMPTDASEVCGYIREAAIAGRSSDTIDAVVGPASGGMLLAFEVGRQLQRPALFTELDKAGEHGFRRGCRPRNRARVLVVDDVLVTGRSLTSTINAVVACGAEVAVVVVVVDRSVGSTRVLTTPDGQRHHVTPLWTADLPVYEAGPGCPGCAAGEPVVQTIPDLLLG